MHDACSGLTNEVVTVSSINNTLYYVNQPARYIKFNQFSISINSVQCTDITFTYIARKKGESSLPGFILFDSNNLIFQIQSSNSEDAGNYVIEIIGYPSVGAPATMLWNV